jgi:plastocyanin/uncharacterized membrane protein
MRYETDQARRLPSVTASIPTRQLTRSALGLIAAVAFLAPAIAQPTAAQPKYVVIIKQMRFNPPQISVSVGDSVEWKNEDIFSHTVTANDGSFDSGLIPPNNSWQTIIKGTGIIGYHCRPHPNMAAQLVVEGTAQGETHGQNEAYRHEKGTAGLKWKFPSKPEELHPILVNFTAALLPLALLSDLLGRVFRRAALHATGFWLVMYAAIITPFTAVAGWWWKSSVGAGLDPVLITVHQWLGTAAALMFVLLAVWRWWIHRRHAAPSVGYLAFALLVVIALVYQGSLGGEMAFGH